MQATCKPVTHWDSNRAVHSPSPSPIYFPGRCRIWKSPAAGLQVWKERAPACLFSHAHIYLYHTGSRNQSCHTFLICSDGMKSHRPGKKDHDGNCPYVEIRSCDLARRKRIFVKGWTVQTDGSSGHQSYNSYTWMGSCCRYQQLTTLCHLCWIHQTPQDSGESHVPLARPGRSVSQPKECSSILCSLLNQLKGTQLPFSMRTWLPLLICHNLWASSSLTQYKPFQSNPIQVIVISTLHHTAGKSLNWPQTWVINCGIY